jgi:hypothetical protein
VEPGRKDRMRRPFELTPEELKTRLDEMVTVTFADLQSQFLVLPKSPGFIEFGCRSLSSTSVAELRKVPQTRFTA